MKKLLPALLFVLVVPCLGWSQGLQISSLAGKVEIRQATGKAVFLPLTAASRQVEVGDQIRTGPGASVVLTLPDSSYMVVSENSDVVIRDFWSGTIRNTVNIYLGRVRFVIERLGGRPNPYHVETPTALIAVRGTTFDVTIDGAGYTEVRCAEGQVAVESRGVPNREVIVNPGWHTLVVPGLAPTIPVANDVAALPNRTLKIQKKGPEDAREISPRSLDEWMRDNDRNSRPADRNPYPGSQSDPNVGRAKPLNYPE